MLAALRVALAGGPAVAPRIDGHVPEDLPSTVPQSVALVIETSGSTGRPKRVALSADAVLAGAAAADQSLAGPGQWLLALPTHYIAGVNVLVRSIASGTEPVMLASGHIDPVDFVGAVARLEHPIRYTSFVPAQLAALLDAAEAEPAVAAALARFSAVLVGGQATPAPLIARARAVGVAIVRTYGSSETSGGCVYDGVPVGRTRVEIVDGQIELSGPSLADGYLDDPARTEAAFSTRGGVRWYRTGDTGAIDVDGAVSVTGRLDDVIVSGGEGLAGSGRTARARTAGSRDGRRRPGESPPVGEVPVVVTTGREPDLAELRAAIGARAGRAAAPDRVVVVAESPTLPSGKPDRRALERLVAP
nr:o-succinylbenzoate--CoA ligase [Microbacterium flavescens]